MINRLKQNLRVIAPILALAFYLGGAQAESFSELEDPFVVIDYDASITRLPSEYQQQAREWRKQLLGLESQLSQETANQHLRLEVSFNALYQQLEQLFYEAKIDVVKVNILEELPAEEQLSVLKLWRDIQSKEIALLAEYYNQNTEQQLAEQYARLDEILSSLN
ncbi:hypothetical protein ACVFI8_03075 [Agarivorans sp. MS3-6]